MDAPLVFIHLSDIHFNKKGLDHYDLDKDLRDQLERDVREKRKQFNSVRGVLVSGDVAFGGQKEEYEVAKKWLKDLCEFAGCKEADVWCIPGNHDVDRKIYENDAVLQDLHETLRPGDPTKIDAAIARYLRGQSSRDLLFQPLDNYNVFAAIFKCRSLPDPLCWQHDLPLNDSSTLRLYGINSAIVCDSKDDRNARRMIVGTIQAKPKEEDHVTYLIMCHHPPDWLLDQDNVINCLDNRARIQLFGHKHFHKIMDGKNCLRISAGAVHPSRAETNWIPRYNWLSVAARTSANERLLDVEVHPRKWVESSTAFKPDYEECDGAEFKKYTLKLKPWEAPPESSPPPPLSGGFAATPSIGEPAMIATNRADAARTLTYRFLDLPHVTRIEIAQELGLYSNDDEGLRDAELLERIFQRAVQQKILSKLWDLIEKHHEDSRNLPNPFE